MVSELCLFGLTSWCEVHIGYEQYHEPHSEQLSHVQF